MIKSVLLILSLFILNISAAQSADELAVRKILNGQIMSWNQGNLEAFMDGYWQSDSLMFIGKSGITYGWRQTLDHYRKGYADTTAMGKLNFDLIEVKRLSVLYFFVVGKYHLARSIGDLDGTFTLLFRKIKNKWVIIADHSS